MRTGSCGLLLLLLSAGCWAAVLAGRHSLAADMNVKIIIIAGTAVLSVALVALIFMYRSLSGDYDRLEEKFTEQVDEMAAQQKKISDLNRLDTKHTQELTDAKTEINRLRADSERNPERVYIRAECPEIRTGSAPGVDDAVSARPSDSAVRNYWILRERIAESEQMILGLQEYISTQCLR